MWLLRRRLLLLLRLLEAEEAARVEAERLAAEEAARLEAELAEAARVEAERIEAMIAEAVAVAEEPLVDVEVPVHNRYSFTEPTPEPEPVVVPEVVEDEEVGGLFRRLINWFKSVFS